MATLTINNADCLNYDTIYGYVYNWWAAIGDTSGDNVTDKNITSGDDWTVATWNSWKTLSTHVDSDWTVLSNTLGAQLKEIGFDYWTDSGNPVHYGTNTDNFNARGAGSRSYIDGNFTNQKNRLLLWRPEASATPGSGMLIVLRYDSEKIVLSPSSATSGDLINKIEGCSIRLVNNNTSLSDGETGTYEGNDGKWYNTICIGTQEWLQVNLEETKWRDGTDITQIGWDAAGNAAWIAATSAAISIPVEVTTTTTTTP